MTSFLIFLAALAGIVIVAVVVNKIKGAKALYIETGTLVAGEALRFEDKDADFYTVTVLGQAKLMTFGRLARAHALITNQRIIIGQKTLFGGKYMITNMFYYDAASAPAGVLDELMGGQLSLGYLVRLIDRTNSSQEIDGEKRYVKIIPQATASATNVAHCRLYTEHAGAMLTAMRV